MKFFKSALILSCLALFIFACNQGANTSNNGNSTAANKITQTSPNTTTTTNQTTTTGTPGDEMAQAKALYSQYCVKCHKEDGTGGISEVEGKKIKAVNFASPGMKKESDEDLFAEISFGVEDEGMPAFKGRLTDDQIKSLVKYIRNEFQKQ